MSVYFDRIQSFVGPAVTEPRKAQRCKLLEEAAEAFAAAQFLADNEAEVPSPLAENYRADLADELADTIQAADRKSVV